MSTFRDVFNEFKLTFFLNIWRYGFIFYINALFVYFFHCFIVTDAWMIPIIAQITKIYRLKRNNVHRNEILACVTRNCWFIRHTLVFRKHTIRVVFANRSKNFKLAKNNTHKKTNLSFMYENIQKEFLKTMGKFYIVTLVKNRRQRINRVMFLT